MNLQKVSQNFPQLLYVEKTKSRGSYFILEYVGVDLQRYHTENRYIGTVAEMGIQMLDILEDLHSCGLIHRDIKPDNFFINS